MNRVLTQAPKYPVSVSQLINYLRAVNLYETQKAQQAIREKIAKSVKNSIHERFNSPPPEMDSLALKKIITSLLTAGKAGEDRLSSILSTIDFKSSLIKSPTTPLKVSEQLRTDFIHARRAKVMLDNLSKYINAVLKYAQESNRSQNKNQLIKNQEQLSEWVSGIYANWGEDSTLKDANLYRNSFSIFMGTFDEDLNNAQYQLILEERIESYLNPNYEAYLEQLLSDTYAEENNPISVTSRDNFEHTTQIEIKILSGELYFYVIMPDDFSSDLKQIKSEILWTLSNKKEFKNLSFSISSIESITPTLCIRLKNPSDKRTFDLLNKTIHNFFDLSIKEKRDSINTARFTPLLFSDAREIGQTFMAGNNLIVDLTATEEDVRKRISDFISGLTFSSNGTIERINSGVFKVEHATNENKSKPSNIEPKIHVAKKAKVS